MEQWVRVCAMVVQEYPSSYLYIFLRFLAALVQYELCTMIEPTLDGDDRSALEVECSNLNSKIIQNMNYCAGII